MGGCVSSQEANIQHLHSSSTQRLPYSATRKLLLTDNLKTRTKMSTPATQGGASGASTTKSKPAPNTTAIPLATRSTPKMHRMEPSSDENSVNTQPSLPHLYEGGFITPLSIQFVRNRGAIPKLDWKEHKLHIKGLVHKPKFFTMDQLASMPTVTMPVSVTSANNRGKEMNMVKVTSGLSWGAAATSCSFWTGVRLIDILKLCEVDVSRSKHIHFIASKEEKLPKGTYGSSIDIETALNPFSNAIIAYKQNGEHISERNGFPIRLIVPGWIGARMVKWLSSIEVSDTPLESHYCRYENRIFPSIVDRKLADSQRYWYQEQYAFNELNINSVIVHPCHKYVLEMDDNGLFEVRGYAYSGAGRKITRVEISFDGGQSWNVCSLSFPEEKLSQNTKYGKYYCWMFWSFQVETSDFREALRQSKELRCRAWDQSNNTQPREMNWNMLGCGNNAHYIVKAKPSTESQTCVNQGAATEPGFRINFLHPTVAGGNQGGWMEEPNFRASLFSETVETVGSEGLHAKKQNMNSNYIQKEQNGERESRRTGTRSGHTQLISNPEASTSKENYGVHALKGFNIPGDRVDGPIPESRLSRKRDASLTPNRRVANIPIKALDPSAWLSFELVEKKVISYDTRIFKFKLPSKNHYLGIPVGQHILVRTMINGEPLIRSYTPISSEKQLGHFTLCIKVYPAGSDLQHPNGGKMSQFMEGLLLGDMMSVTGPCGQVHYKGNGIVSFERREKEYQSIGLICGGSGITPAFQVMHNVYQSSSDKTKIFLLYANRTQYDILLQPDLDLMAQKRENIHVWYTLEKIPTFWMYSHGLVTEQMIRDRIPGPADDTLILLCGPPDMISSCLSSLQNIGYKKENIMNF